MLRIRRYVIKTNSNNKKRLDEQEILKERIFNSNYRKKEIPTTDDWRHYLTTMRDEDGSFKYPRYNSEGKPYAYEVYFWGMDKFLKEKLGISGKNSGYYCLFPGMDSSGKRLSLIKFGVLEEVSREN